MRARAWGPPTSVVVLLGCQLLVDVEGAADGGVANVVDGDGASISNDAGQADAGLVRCPAARAGPDLVPTDGFCIDRTEVSAHQYDEFLSADKGGIALPPACDGHSSYAPLVGAPSPDHPVLVAWCDAYAFCQWAGKRLCGATDGGGAIRVEDDTFRDKRGNEWLRACVHGDVGSVFPYGNDFDRDACGPEHMGGSYGGLTPVGVHPRCAGGYPGLLDMSGNASEWVNAFISVPPSISSDGASVTSPIPHYAMGSAECRSVLGGYADIASVRFGIRCCVTP